jgi:hypothetical protein
MAMKHNFKRTFDAVEIQPERQKQIRSMLSSRISEKQEDTMSKIYTNTDTHKHPRKMGRILIAVSIATVLLAGTALAAYELGIWNPKLAEIFDVDEERQQTLIEEGTTVVVNEYVTDNGLTIEAVQTIAGKNALYILLDVIAPEGVSLTESSVFEAPRISVDGLSGYNYGITGGFLQKDERDIANQRYYEIWVFSDEATIFSNAEIHLNFKNLQADSGKHDFYTVLEGSWEMSWTLAHSDDSKMFALNENISIGGYDIVVESVEISAMSITVKLGGNQVVELAKAMDISNDIDASLALRLTLDDGTIFDASGGPGSGALNDSGTLYSISQSFYKVLDVERADELVLNYRYNGETDVVAIPLG